MSNKKTLKEVFEFFPKAKWITQDGKKSERPNQVYIYLNTPEQWTPYESEWWRQDKESIGNEVISIPASMINIDWGERRAWLQRCISREEVMGEQ